MTRRPGGRCCWLAGPLPHDAFDERAVGNAVEVAVLGAEDHGGVSYLLDGAFDAVHGDLVALAYAFADVAAGGDVAREPDEAAAQRHGGYEADGGEEDDGEEDQNGGLEAELSGGYEAGDGDHDDKDRAPEDTPAVQARALRLAGDQLGEPAGANHPGDDYYERHQRPSGEVDDLVHGVFQGREAQDAQGARHPGEHHAPQDHVPHQPRWAAVVAELPQGVGDPGTLEKLFEPDGLQESGNHSPQHERHDQRHDQHHERAHEPRDELRRHVHQIPHHSVQGVRHRASPLGTPVSRGVAAQPQIVNESAGVGAAQAPQELLRLPEEGRDVGPPDGVVDDAAGRLGGLLLHHGEEYEHAVVGLRRAPVVRVFEEQALRLAGLHFGELARGVCPYPLHDFHTPLVHYDARFPSPLSRVSGTSLRSSDARPREAQPLAVPSGTSRIWAISP